jgi:hypothetical protein
VVGADTWIGRVFRLGSRPALLTVALAALLCAPAWAQAPLPDPGRIVREPQSGDPGKDVIFVPTPETLVERMLDMARVTAADFVVDLGSGDGRIVVAAARRGARALGVEYNPDLVAVARRRAAAESVADRARFVQGDMYEADISGATVLALFLLPANLEKLKAKFTALPRGTRIVNNGYRIPGWQEDQVGIAGDCGAWCTAYLYVLPARQEP